MKGVYVILSIVIFYDNHSGHLTKVDIGSLSHVHTHGKSTHVYPGQLRPCKKTTLRSLTILVINMRRSKTDLVIQENSDHP